MFDPYLPTYRPGLCSILTSQRNPPHSTRHAASPGSKHSLLSVPQNNMPTFVITGCSSGIGLDLVKALASRGDKVYATVRSKSGSKSGADEISSVEGDVTIVEGIDVAKDDVGDALKAALSGVTIDCLINNSGIAGGGDDMFAAQKLDKVSPPSLSCSPRAWFPTHAVHPTLTTHSSRLYSTPRSHLANFMKNFPRILGKYEHFPIN